PLIARNIMGGMPFWKRSRGSSHTRSGFLRNVASAIPWYTAHVSGVIALGNTSPTFVRVQMSYGVSGYGCSHAPGTSCSLTALVDMSGHRPGEKFHAQAQRGCHPERQRWI